MGWLDPGRHSSGLPMEDPGSFQGFEAIADFSGALTAVAQTSRNQAAQTRGDQSGPKCQHPDSDIDAADAVGASDRRDQEHPAITSPNPAKVRRHSPKRFTSGPIRTP